MLFRLTGKRLGQYSGILGWLALGIILSLLLAVFPAVPARAEAELFLDPTEGKVGDRVYVTGTEFEAEEYFYLYFSNDMASIGNYIEEKLTHYKLLLTRFPVNFIPNSVSPINLTMAKILRMCMVVSIMSMLPLVLTSR